MFQSMTWVAESQPPSHKGIVYRSSGSGNGFTAEVLKKDVETLIENKLGDGIVRL